MVFSRALRRFPHRWMKGEDSFSTPVLWISLLYMRRRALGRDLAKTLNNNFEWRQRFYYFIVRWRITLLKQRGLCELSEIAETLYSLRKGFQVVLVFIWLYGNTGAVDDLPRSRNSKKRKISHRQGKKVSSEWRLFSKMNFCLSFFMLSNRIQVPRTQRTCERELRKLMWL